MQKTNAMRILDSHKVNYEVFEYDNSLTSGELVANALNEPYEKVFKTLVTVSNNGEHFVYVIPVDKTLDMKLCARVAGVKSVEMLKQKDLLGLTGYIHGGCSPIGMKKPFKTFIDESVKEFDYFYVSAGKVGMQVKVNPRKLSEVCGAEFVKLVNV